MRIAICLVLLSVPFLGGVLAQTPAGDNAGAGLRPYEGLLRESDLRIRELRRMLTEGKSAPEEMRLRYRGTQGNYAVFYDVEGREAFYHYRSDPFDDLSERKLRDLRTGQAYRVRGTFSGIMDEGMIHAPQSERYAAILASANGQPVFEFAGAETIQPEYLFF